MLNSFTTTGGDAALSSFPNLLCHGFQALRARDHIDEENVFLATSGALKVRFKDELKVLEMHSYAKQSDLWEYERRNTFIVMVGKTDNQLSRNVKNSASEKQPKQELK